MLILRQSTAIDIRMGPFVDTTDGVTPETGVTLAGADQAEVLKENGAATAAMAGTFAAVTGADGWYDYTASTTDTNTVGEIVFVVQDASVCLPVFVRAMVIEEAIYDAIYDAGATLAGNIATMVAGIIEGTCSGTPTTSTTDSNLTGYTADQLIGRTITFVTGTADGQQSIITDYVVTNGVITYATLNGVAPASTDTFKIT